MNNNKGPFSTIKNAITTVLTGGLSYVLRRPSEQTIQSYETAAAQVDRYNAEVARSQAEYAQAVQAPPVQPVPVQEIPYIEREPMVLERRLSR